MGFDGRWEWESEEGQVHDQVERVVAGKFVRKAQGPVPHAVFGQHNGVFEGSAPDEAHFPQRFDMAFETEGARPRQQVAERLRADHHFHFLLADQRVRKIDIATHTKLVRWINPYAPVAFHDFQRLQHLQIPPPSAQFANASLHKHLYDRLGRAIQNGHFNRINVDVVVFHYPKINPPHPTLLNQNHHPPFTHTYP